MAQINETHPRGNREYRRKKLRELKNDLRRLKVKPALTKTEQTEIKYIKEEILFLEKKQ